MKPARWVQLMRMSIHACGNKPPGSLDTSSRCLEESECANKASHLRAWYRFNSYPMLQAATETVQAIIVWLKARELGMEVSAAAQGRDRLREVATQLQQRLANKAAPMASK